jgi:hypothetical protein
MASAARFRFKVVASTATVRRAKEQVHGIFVRDVAIFPPPLIDAGNTFFSRQIGVDTTHPGRRYVGICAHGQRLKQVQIRVAQLVLSGAQLLFDEHGTGADPYMTLVDYFSSTTELAGMRRLVDDDVATRLRQQVRRGMRHGASVRCWSSSLAGARSGISRTLARQETRQHLSSERRCGRGLPAVLWRWFGIA